MERAVSTETLEQRILAAINAWPNKPWLVLPGPTDLAPELAKYIARHIYSFAWESVPPIPFHEWEARGSHHEPLPEFVSLLPSPWKLIKRLFKRVRT